MLKLIGVLALHIVCIYFLRLLWKDKNEADQRGGVLTKMGYVSKGKSPRLFRFSIWVDFIILLLLYIVLIAYSLWLVFP
jgi:hypothetical protein